MFVEIRNAGFINKGAELMLHAAWKKMKTVFPTAKFVMAPTLANGSAPFIKRCELGLYQKAWMRRYGLNWGDLTKFVPKKIRELYGVVLDREIHVVLDAAGFAYSDQWGTRSCFELAQSCLRWRKQGTKVILLPQAFGPFKIPKNKECMKVVAEMADLIFVRDPVSYQYLTEIVGERDNIKIAPDFTNLIDGISPLDFDKDNNRFCIVPNYRMIDKSSKKNSEDYLPFMVTCAKILVEIDAKPFILVHEGANDHMLADKIQKGVGGAIPIIQENNPLKIKGILGVCDGTLGSRFHGLVSALSQGVPSLATGWSHKYEMLFNEYGVGEGLLDLSASEATISQKLELLTNMSSRHKIRSGLLAKSTELKKKSEKMWADVFEVLEVGKALGEK